MNERRYFEEEEAIYCTFDYSVRKKKQDVVVVVTVWYYNTHSAASIILVVKKGVVVGGRRKKKERTASSIIRGAKPLAALLMFRFSFPHSREKEELTF